MAIIKILIALAILMFLAFKGVPIILTSIISGAIFLLISDPSSIYEGLTTTFMAGAASFVQA